jgi:MFS transporter, FLVCR family, MFS-domain-containing protein 7
MLLTPSLSVDAFSTLSDQILAPYGYPPTVAGLTATVLLGVGLLTAMITAPLLDMVFMKRMALTIKLLSLLVGPGWLALIWAVKPHNTAGILVVMAMIGAGSLTMLPVGLEMAVEVTRNAEGSAAIFNALNALEGVIFVQSEHPV